MKEIYHIVTEKPDWKDNEYKADSLESEGFIHCSFAEQVNGIANFKFQAEEILFVLKIDPQKLKSEIKVEDLYNLNKEYPHIYGPINKEALIEVLEMKKEGKNWTLN